MKLAPGLSRLNPVPYRGTVVDELAAQAYAFASTSNSRHLRD